ncbi:hypothetical protein S7711_04703 [Stachybotrys chartarum IBT 7711]|uniref:RBR-type E3 ubiquitin transferase n=1 Tax=Stachybotrys chartarum (strain CBS 109288 / IBT 7711) TaxID=1280523 RepID=A0A084ANZ2_STACB|nr:hypothetical protein S7711_04703 [Stachybotrys chartarum IBT 7711]
MDPLQPDEQNLQQMPWSLGGNGTITGNAWYSNVDGEGSDLAIYPDDDESESFAKEMLDRMGSPYPKTSAQPNGHRTAEEMQQGTSTAELRDPDEPLRTMECVACQEEHVAGTILEAPCGHSYCRACLVTMFTRTLTNETLFPPNCCQQAFPTDGFAEILPATLLAEFIAKAVEYGTSNKTYCHRQQCSAFIPKEDIYNGIAWCPKCREATCANCKAAPHLEKDCPPDAEEEVVLSLARREGWIRCKICSHVIEHIDGCNHMTCVCNYEFCYRCAEAWGTCECPEYGNRGVPRDVDLDNWLPRADPRYVIWYLDDGSDGSSDEDDDNMSMDEDEEEEYYEPSESNASNVDEEDVEGDVIM